MFPKFLLFSKLKKLAPGVHKHQKYFLLPLTIRLEVAALRWVRLSSQVEQFDMALTYQMFSWSTGVTPSLKHISASQILITYNNELDFEAKDAEFWEMAEKQQELQWRWSKKLSGLQVSGVRWIIQNTIRPSSALDWHSWPSNLPITDDRHYHSLAGDSPSCQEDWSSGKILQWLFFSCEYQLLSPFEATL